MVRRRRRHVSILELRDISDVRGGVARLVGGLVRLRAVLRADG